MVEVEEEEEEEEEEDEEEEEEEKDVEERLRFWPCHSFLHRVGNVAKGAPLYGALVGDLCRKKTRQDGYVCVGVRRGREVSTSPPSPCPCILARGWQAGRFAPQPGAPPTVSWFGCSSCGRSPWPLPRPRRRAAWWR